MNQNKIQLEIREGKYLTFTLDQEDYGIRISKVKEIIGMIPITSVPQTPEYLKGVINLRGRVIPVVDLRIRFAMPSMAYSDRTCIIVIEIAGDSGPLSTGVVVDSVSEVLSISQEHIQDPPGFGARMSADYILGMAVLEKSVKVLLDIDLILNSSELSALES